MSWFFDADYDLDYLIDEERDDWLEEDTSSLLQDVFDKPLPLESFACYQQDPFHYQLSCNKCYDTRYLDVQKHFVFFTWAADFYCHNCDKQWFVCRYCTYPQTSKRCGAVSPHNQLMTTLDDLNRHVKLKRHQKAVKKHEEQQQQQQELQQQQGRQDRHKHNHQQLQRR